MYRFFSFAVLFNWLVVLAMLAVVGTGFDNDSSGLVDTFANMLSAEEYFAVPANIANAISIVAALSVLTAGFWAIMALMFADRTDQENREQAFVITTALGYCLILFAFLIALGVGVGNHQFSATASVASLATVLAGIAQRMLAIEAQTLTADATRGEHSLSMLHAQAMANQSAKLASVGARSARFVPKQRFSSYYTNQ